MPALHDNPENVLLSEYVSEGTRRDRRTLIAVSSVALFIGVTGAFPTQMTTLGTPSGSITQQAIAVAAGE